MIIALLAVTALEMVLLIAVLAAYLIAVDRVLGRISGYLGKITFGVRAVESQTGPIGPSVLRINATLREINGALDTLAGKARQAVNRQGRPPG